MPHRHENNIFIRECYALSWLAPRRYFSRLKRVCRTQTLISTEHHISSLHSRFWGQLSAGSPFVQPDKNRKFLRFFIVLINFKIFFWRDSSALSVLGSYSPEIDGFFVLLLCLLKYLGL